MTKICHQNILSRNTVFFENIDTASIFSFIISVLGQSGCCCCFVFLFTVVWVPRFRCSHGSKQTWIIEIFLDSTPPVKPRPLAKKLNDPSCGKTWVIFGVAFERLESSWMISRWIPIELDHSLQTIYKLQAYSLADWLTVKDFVVVMCARLILVFIFLNLDSHGSFESREVEGGDNSLQN